MQRLTTLVRFFLLVTFMAPFNMGYASVGDCKVVLSGSHYRIDILNESALLYKTPITTYSTCELPIHLSSSDKKYNLTDKKYTLEDHYFNWNHWESSIVNGDGGVDVTGAPKRQLVEGANSVKISINSGDLLRLSIAIPAEGYMMFDWDHIGSSTTSNVTFLINDQPQKTYHQQLTPQKLNQGDRIAIEFENTGQLIENFVLYNFRFISNTPQVIERSWVGVDPLGNKNKFNQFIAIEKYEIGEIIFPPNHEKTTSALINKDKLINPSITGYPFFDQDRNPNTDFDQMPIEINTIGLKMAWVDKVISSTATNLEIERSWTIQDMDTKNIFMHKQHIKIHIDKFTERGIALGGLKKLTGNLDNNLCEENEAFGLAGSPNTSSPEED